IDLVNAQGKSIQDLVAEGQLTPEQYATLIQTINGLISKGNVKPDDLSPELLELINKRYATLIQTINGLIPKGNVKPDDLSPELLELINNGDGTPFEILSIPRDKSVTPSKTTFIEESTNLLNLENMTENKTFNGDGTSLSDSNTLSITDHIYIEKSSRLTFLGAYGYVQYDDNGDVVSRHYLSSESTPVTRLMNIQTHSIRVEVYNHKISEARINVGDVLLPYETYKHHLKE